MRKIIALLLICLALLAGCARQADAPSAGPTQTPEPISGVTLEPVPVETQPAATFGFEASAAAETISFDEAWARVRSDADAVYLFAANVGKGDALVLRFGDWIGLIDTGKTRARGRVLQALKLMGFNDSWRLDGVFLTHTDDDHAGGLRWMTAEAESDALPARKVEAMYASAMYTGVKTEKHPAVRAAGGAQWLRRGDAVALGDTGAVLQVLAPNSLYDDEDDNSLVMMLESAHGRLLLTGDMELYEEAELLSLGDDLKCDVLKVANHGDADATCDAFASACAAQIAVISTSGEEKPGTPDPGVVRRLRAAGGNVIVTEDSGLGILVTLKNGVATASYVDFGAAADLTGVSVAEVDASDDRIVLQNNGDAPVDLYDCYLYSDRGDETFAFAEAGESVVIEPGATLTVGTNSTKGSYDLLWDDKKVVNKKKADTICLYDAQGRLIDWMDNGE